MAEKEYIARETVLDYIDKRIPILISSAGGKHIITVEAVRNVIEKFPTADVEPVRHGHWISLDDYFEAAECSECGDALDIGECSFDDFCECYHYCPNCGAKMDVAEPATNYDRNYDILCTLSQEEMADELLKAEWCDSSCAYGSDMKAEQCKECMLKWLNSKRKDDKK